MNEEQEKQVVDALVTFVTRTAAEKLHSENNATILPEVVRALNDINNNAMEQYRRELHIEKENHKSFINGLSVGISLCAALMSLISLLTLLLQ